MEPMAVTQGTAHGVVVLVAGLGLRHPDLALFPGRPIQRRAGHRVTFFKHRDNADTSVTVPFAANVVFSLLFFASVFRKLSP
jgi:hypothetical protein